MRAGQLDRRWTILEAKRSRNAFGEEEISWQSVQTVWGSWEPLRGSEKWSAQQYTESAIARVRVRHNSSITPFHRIQSDELGQFQISGEPEQYRRTGETVLHVRRIVD